jgi:hypothetical protein
MCRGTKLCRRGFRNVPQKILELLLISKTSFLAFSLKNVPRNIFDAILFAAEIFLKISVPRAKKV